MRYSKDLIVAVKYLYEKGFRSSEIARRLGVSPFTVRNVISILKKGPKVKEFVWKDRAGNKVVLRVPENIYNVLEYLRGKRIVKYTREILGIAMPTILFMR
ncbi:MAG: hypothetical protein B6U76_12035 [Desulfurococcales archaeon ex4484_217_2]|nr:MAG: hypothetical protein B6U76_12035 [Desulfurococcales archaeon ex4484_217_2]